MPHVALQRRLRRLERANEASSDGSGFVPHSTEWLNFWLRWAARQVAGEDPEPKCITIEAFRAIVALVPAESAEEP